MRVLILNVGSSSIKYDFFKDGKKIKRGKIDRINEIKGRTYDSAVRDIFRKLGSVDIIGHRVVHGCEFKKPRLLCNRFIEQLKKFAELAPLHDYPELKVIEICKRYKIKQYAIFDTEFHDTIPEVAKTYALPYKLCKKYKIERYGFHGINHKHMYEEACKKLKRRNINLITCHLGNGCSITAIKNGKSIDTSMGFTPLEGLVMGTRAGNIDPGIILFLMRKGYSYNQLSKLLTEESGLKGISGRGRDVRDLIKSKDKRAKLAINIFIYSIVKYIGAYSAILGKVDLVVFSGGIGENEKELVNRIMKHFNRFKYIIVRADEGKIIYNELIRIIR